MLELRNISKTFGAFHALKSVSLAIRPGEIHGLVGRTVQAKAPC